MRSHDFSNNDYPSADQPYIIVLLDPVDAVQLVVEPAGVADGLALAVPPPQRGRVGPAVGADHPRPPVARPAAGDLQLGRGPHALRNRTQKLILILRFGLDPRY